MIAINDRRVSASAGTDLDPVLRCLSVRDLMVCGLITSGAVLSTVRQGADMDYRLAVGAARWVCGLGGRYSGRVDGVRCCPSRRAWCLRRSGLLGWGRRDRRYPCITSVVIHLSIAVLELQG